jgi:aconitate hydratase
VVTLDLGTVAPSLAGPKRPQDRIEIGQVAAQFDRLFAAASQAENGFNQPVQRLSGAFKPRAAPIVRDGDVLIAAITSCTNTSNPGVLLAAGLLAKKAVEAG